MMTLDDGINPAIELPSSLEWTDRFKSRGRQNVRFTIGGSFISQGSNVKAGNTVTLVGGGVWITYSTLLTLIAESEIPGKTYTLTLPDGTVMTVIWNLTQGDPITASPVLRCETYQPDDPFNNVTLRFYRVDEAA